MNPEKSTPQIAYEAYGQSRNWQTYDGKPMPQWDELPPEIVIAWGASVIAVVENLVYNLHTHVNKLVEELESDSSSVEVAL